GTTPTNGVPSLGPVSSGDKIAIAIDETDVTFKIRGFKPNFKSSDVGTKIFSPTNFVPNRISFGFAAGEASSDFVASAGQRFYAPITLSMLPNSQMYSLQFNMSVQ